MTSQAHRVMTNRYYRTGYRAALIKRVFFLVKN